MSAPKKQRTETPEAEDAGACVGISINPFPPDGDATKMHFVADLHIDNTTLLMRNEDGTGVGGKLCFTSLVAHATEAWTTQGFDVMRISEKTQVPLDATTAGNPACDDTALALDQYFIDMWWKQNWRCPEVIKVVSRLLANTPGSLYQTYGSSLCDVDLWIRLYAWATADAPRVATEQLAKKKAAYRAAKYRAEAAELFDPDSPFKLLLVTTHDLTGFVPEDTKCFELVARVKVAGSHTSDNDHHTIKSSIEVDVTNVESVMILDPPAEFQALDLTRDVEAAVKDGEAEAILDKLSEEFVAAYKADDVHTGDAKISVKFRVYAPADVAERKRAAKRAVEAEKDRLWKNNLNQVLSVEKNRMAEPVMVISKEDFEKMKRLDCFSLFPDGSQWLCFAAWKFIEVPDMVSGAGAGSLLPLSQAWNDALRNTIMLRRISLDDLDGPIYVCVLADVVGFLKDPTCPVPAVIPYVRGNTSTFSNWGNCWMDNSSLSGPGAPGIIVSWGLGLTKDPLFLPLDTRKSAIQLTNYYNHKPFGRAHVLAVVTPDTTRACASFGDYFVSTN